MVRAAAKITNTNSESLLLVNSVVGHLAEAAKNRSLMRVDQRYDLQCKVLIGTKSDQGQFVPTDEAWGHDISNTGLGLFTSKSFQVGHSFYIVMRPSKNSHPLFALVRVRRCERLTAEIFKIGALFVFDDDATESQWR